MLARTCPGGDQLHPGESGRTCPCWELGQCYNCSSVESEEGISTLFMPHPTANEHQVLQYRKERLSRARVSHGLSELIATGRVSSLVPVIIGKFAWVFLDKQVVLAQGKRSYSFFFNWLRRSTSCLFVFEVRWQERQTQCGDRRLERRRLVTRWSAGFWT